MDVIEIKRGCRKLKNCAVVIYKRNKKSRGVITASLDFLVSIAQAVHSLLMLCDSSFLRFDGKGTPSFFYKDSDNRINKSYKHGSNLCSGCTRSRINVHARAVFNT